MLPWSYKIFSLILYEILSFFSFTLSKLYFYDVKQSSNLPTSNTMSKNTCGFLENAIGQIKIALDSSVWMIPQLVIHRNFMSSTSPPKSPRTHNLSTQHHFFHSDSWHLQCTKVLFLHLTRISSGFCNYTKDTGFTLVKTFILPCLIVVNL